MAGVLMATVGLSPLPVAVAVLTLSPDVLVLVHSTVSEDEALRIKIFAEERIGKSLVVELVPVGDGRDLYDTHRLMQAGLAEQVPADVPFRLVYNGGTAAMVTCAVRIHDRMHGGRPDLRLYVDDEQGVMLGDDGFGYRLAPPLGLRDIARLHGYMLTGGRIVANPDQQVGADTITRAWAARFDAPRGGVDPAQTLIDQLAEVADWHHLGADEAASPWELPPESTKRRGDVAELCCVAAILGGRFDEVAHAAEVSRGGVDVTDFDVLVRRGRRIVAVEVKNAPGYGLRASGASMVLARAVFGSTTRTLIVSWRGEVRAIEAQLARWNHDLPALQRLEWFDVDCGDGTRLPHLHRSVAEMLNHRSPHAVLAGPVQGLRDPRPEDPPVNGRVERPPPPMSVATALGGSRLAAQSAAKVWTGSALTVMTTRAAWSASHRALRAGRARPRFLVGTGAADVAEACQALPGSTFVVTPGTKSATAAMAAVRAADLVHVDVRKGLAHSWQHGTWPHDPEIVWADVARPGLVTAVDDAWWSEIGSLLHRSDASAPENGSASPAPRHDVTALRRVVAWAATQPGVDVWFSSDPSAPWWVPIMLTGRSRAVGVVATAHRKLAFAAATHLAAMAGDAARVLVLVDAARTAESARTIWGQAMRGLIDPVVAVHDRTRLDSAELADALGIQVTSCTGTRSVP